MASGAPADDDDAEDEHEASFRTLLRQLANAVKASGHASVQTANAFTFSRKSSHRRDLHDSAAALWGVWTRFLMHQLLLPIGIERAMYLDSDTLVRSDLRGLWRSGCRCTWENSLTSLKAIIQVQKERGQSIP